MIVGAGGALLFLLPLLGSENLAVETGIPLKQGKILTQIENDLGGSIGSFCN